TDGNGFAVIQQPITVDPNTVTIRVSAQDSTGNTVQAERSMDFFQKNSDPAEIYFHDLQLNNLDIATDKLTYNIGDTAKLVINSPFDQNVLLSYESGRIYQSEWLTLH